jgi:hypothetical protein
MSLLADCVWPSCTCQTPPVKPCTPAQECGSGAACESYLDCQDCTVLLCHGPSLQKAPCVNNCCLPCSELPGSVCDSVNSNRRE